MMNEIAYKFRAECIADAQAVRAVLLPWLLEWSENRANLQYEGVLHPMPDVDVEFTVAEEGPTLAEMLWLLDGIDNCHVASDTLTTIESYTGKRKFRGRFESPAARPRASVLSEAMAGVRARQKTLDLELERALQLHRTYEAASRFGEKWQPFRAEEPDPGWMVPVEHQQTGMTALRRVSAPLWRKNWKKHVEQIVQARIFTISA
jgi:hypothetical protein